MRFFPVAKTVALIYLISAPLFGCASPISVAGHSVDYSEIYYGDGVSTDGFNSDYQVTFKPSGVRCSVKSRPIDVLAGRWRESFTCEDGRTGTLDSSMYNFGHGHGDFVFSDGTSFYHIGGLKGLAEGKYAEYVAEQQRRGLASTTSTNTVKKTVTRTPQKIAANEPQTSYSNLPTKPIDVSFVKGTVRPDDVAVIIGNADYTKLGRDIPNVTPAYADAAGVKKYVMETLGVREGNIIDMHDATGAQLQRVFGTADTARGQLYDWVRPGRSRVFVYYAGHGAPAGSDGSAFLVPSDSDATRININGYPLSLMYKNLSQLPAKSVTVVLEACFSGASQAGSVITKASPIYVKPKSPKVPANITLLAAGAPEQLASWDQDARHGLFTTYFLKGMSGEADAKPSGNGDGKVSLAELEVYLKDTLTYYARRYYGRDQTAVIITGKGN